MSDNMLAWSHSRVETYQTCPHKFYRLNILKDVKIEETEAMGWGKKVHKAFERRLMFGADFPSNMSQYELYAVKILTLKERMGPDTIMQCEQQLALDRKLKVCGWFDKDCWVRIINDVSLINLSSGNAITVDWKTGKKKDDDRQLALQAAGLFRQYPDIERVSAAYCWLKENGEMKPVNFSRMNERQLWSTYLPVVREMQDEVSIGEWPVKPSGLCGWCPVTDCRHWRHR